MPCTSAVRAVGSTAMTPSSPATSSPTEGAEVRRRKRLDVRFASRTGWSAGIAAYDVTQRRHGRCVLLRVVSAHHPDTVMGRQRSADAYAGRSETTHGRPVAEPESSIAAPSPPGPIAAHAAAGATIVRDLGPAEARLHGHRYRARRRRAIAQLAVLVRTPTPDGLRGGQCARGAGPRRDRLPGCRSTDLDGCHSACLAAVAELSAGAAAPAPQGAVGAGRAGVVGAR